MGLVSGTRLSIDADTSTFIVETPEENWLAAGMEQRAPMKRLPSAKSCSPTIWMASLMAMPST